MVRSRPVTNPVLQTWSTSLREFPSPAYFPAPYRAFTMVPKKSLAAIPIQSSAAEEEARQARPSASSLAPSLGNPPELPLARGRAAPPREAAARTQCVAADEAFKRRTRMETVWLSARAASWRTTHRRQLADRMPRPQGSYTPARCRSSGGRRGGSTNRRHPALPPELREFGAPGASRRNLPAGLRVGAAGSRARDAPRGCGSPPEPRLLGAPGPPRGRSAGGSITRPVAERAGRREGEPDASPGGGLRARRHAHRGPPPAPRGPGEGGAGGEAGAAGPGPDDVPGPDAGRGSVGRRPLSHARGRFPDAVFLLACSAYVFPHVSPWRAFVRLAESTCQSPFSAVPHPRSRSRAASRLSRRAWRRQPAANSVAENRDMPDVRPAPRVSRDCDERGAKGTPPCQLSTIRAVPASRAIG
ncbi:unnamed protein product [Prorocentrum cordatum]|uniref:Uncharacterized protein n=1 Tax=Prorocentrum cordatum TaxID=2364126 RepID=A0ABN9WRJ1_9DINO|nr:unnamed protein product [Polarella glacialis]